jgi:hypothetical protein
MRFVRNSGKILVWEFEKKTKLRLEDKNMKIDITELFVGEMHWIHIPYNRIQWSAHMNTVKKFYFRQKTKTSFTECLLLEKDLTPRNQII